MNPDLDPEGSPDAAALVTAAIHDDWDLFMLVLEPLGVAELRDAVTDLAAHVAAQVGFFGVLRAGPDGDPVAEAKALWADAQLAALRADDNLGE